jgi:Tol biopolymer transport system component
MILNVRTGEVTQGSSIPDGDEFNPCWAPDGKRIAYDVSGGPSPAGTSIFVTDVRSGVSTLLEGGIGGNDPAWSPSGKMIAFDDFSSLFVVRAQGGTPTLIRNDAVDADWSPNSQRLVFRQPSDGSLRTVDKNGEDETIVAYGSNPVWSPSGHWLAYVDGGDIWKIKVNARGQAIGSSVQLTNDPSFESQPSWAPNSKKIVYHSDRDGDFDLWVVKASGGTSTRLTGAVGVGDFDPAFSNSGRFIAYAGLSSAPITKLLPMDLMAEDLDGDVNALPATFEMEQNYPNPFNPTTTIGFAVPDAGEVKLAIYNLRGQLVRILHNGPLAAGHHKVVWDGADAQGAKVATGVYVYRLEGNNFIAHRKLVLAK